MAALHPMQVMKMAALVAPAKAPPDQPLWALAPRLQLFAKQARPPLPAIRRIRRARLELRTVERRSPAFPSAPKPFSWAAHALVPVVLGSSVSVRFAWGLTRGALRPPRR